MKDFSRLISDLELNPDHSNQMDFLVSCFQSISDQDKLCVIRLLSGRSPKRIASINQLKEFCADFSGIPEWLLDESYQITGDWVETISLVLPRHHHSNDKTISQWVNEIDQLSPDKNRKMEFIFSSWKVLAASEIHLFNMLISGRFRTPVSLNILSKSLSQVTGKDSLWVNYRLSQNWGSEAQSLFSLFDGNEDDVLKIRPYPFYRKSPLGFQVSELGDSQDWQVELNRVGIRAQVILRGSYFLVWTENGELITDKFPELEILKHYLPYGAVLDGVLTAVSDGQKEIPVSGIKQHISRKTSKTKTGFSLRFIVHDLLEKDGHDLRNRSLNERSEKLEMVLSLISIPDLIIHSERYKFQSWNELSEFNKKQNLSICDGLILKRSDSIYKEDESGRDWLVLKTESKSVMAVLIYAQKSSDGMPDQFSLYTFGVWNDGQLITIGKTDHGLTDSEKKEIDYFIRQNTLEKFGPVRTVKPLLVFELGYEGIEQSTRHKAGILLRSPKILRWMRNTNANDADHLGTLKSALI